MATHSKDEYHHKQDFLRNRQEDRTGTVGSSTDSVGRQMTFDSAVMECLFDPRTLGYGNELIDIVTAFKRNEITELEAKILVFEIRDVRAKEELIANQLALSAVTQAANQALIALVKQEQENVTRT
jgi:hypothetical protein